MAGRRPGWGEGGRRLVTRGSRVRSPGTLGLGRPEIRGPLARKLVARARNGRQMVAPACEPWGTDSDGA